MFSMGDSLMAKIALFLGVFALSGCSGIAFKSDGLEPSDGGTDVGISIHTDGGSLVNGGSSGSGEAGSSAGGSPASAGMTSNGGDAGAGGETVAAGSGGMPAGGSGGTEVGGTAGVSGGTGGVATGGTGGAGGSSGGGAGNTAGGGSGGSGGTGPVPECTPTDSECHGDTPWTCNSEGFWEVGSACPFVCSQGACTGVCEPTTTDCSDTIPRTCNSLGAWVEGSACPFVCSAGSCIGECDPGTVVCDDAGTKTCGDDSFWETTVACPDTASTNHQAPICSTATCGLECEAGWGDVDGNAANGCEGDVYNDATNCGSVGHNCYGGTCAVGLCSIPGIEQIYEGGGRFFAGFDLVDNEIFWNQGDIDNTYGDHSIQTEGSGLQTYTINDYSVNDYQSNGADVAFSADSGPTATSIFVATLGGNPQPTAVATHTRLASWGGSTAVYFLYNFYLSDDAVYYTWPQSSYVIDCQNISMGTPPFPTYETTTLYKKPLTGGAGTVLATFDSYTTQMVERNGTLYIMKCGKSTSVPPSLTRFSKVSVVEVNLTTDQVTQRSELFQNGWRLAVNDSYIFIAAWEQNYVNSFDDAGIFRIPQAGGTPTLIVSANVIIPTFDYHSLIAANNSDLFFFASGNGTTKAIQKVSVNGGSPTVVVSGQDDITYVEATDSELFWTNDPYPVWTDSGLQIRKLTF